MLTLNSGALKRIKATLDNSLFSSQMFDISRNQGQSVIEIVYLPEPAFRFKAEEVTGRLQSTECPGTIFVEPEDYTLNRPNELEGRIQQWVRRIEEEVQVQDNGRSAIDVFRKQIEDTANKIDSPEKPFTADEAREWTQHFNEMTEKLRTMSDEIKINQSDIQQLKSQLKRMQQVATKMPRSTWLKSTGYKIVQWADSKFDRAIDKSVETGVKTLLELPWRLP